MNSIQANSRETKSKGQVNSLRKEGLVPAIIYGGKSDNQKISVNKKEVKTLIQNENFLSSVISINLDGKEESVLPRDIKFDVVTDEPIHFDFIE